MLSGTWRVGGDAHVEPAGQVAVPVNRTVYVTAGESEFPALPQPPAANKMPPKRNAACANRAHLRRHSLRKKPIAASEKRVTTWNCTTRNAASNGGPVRGKYRCAFWKAANGMLAEAAFAVTCTGVDPPAVSDAL